MKIKVLAIAPYPGLKELLETIVKDDPRIEMNIEVADLQNALPIVMSTKGDRYDVILSRGGTSTLIRSHVSTPVVDIPVSGYDILRVLTLVKHSNSRVAIIGFPNICRGVAEVSSLLDFDIPIYSVEHAGEVRNALEQAFGHGAQIVLGDVVTVNTAEEMGYNGILITSGRESILEALAEVRRMYDVVNKAQENERLYELILGNHRTGVLAIDDQGEIQYANAAASALLGYDQSVIRGMKLSGIDPAWNKYIDDLNRMGASGEPVPSKRLQRRGMHIEMVAPAEQGELGFRYLVYMYPIEQSGVNPALASYEVTERIAAFTQVMGSSSVIRKVVSRAQELATGDSPVWIGGEAGTGKALLAQAIHSASSRRNEPLYMIPCHQLNDQELDALLFGNASYPGLLDKDFAGTVCLTHIEETSQELQGKLLAAIRSGLQARFIVTALLPIKQLLKKELLSPDLADIFNETSLYLPPLRERLEDIDDIARVLIANYNSRFGRQIVGIRRDVLEDQLMNKLWPGNIQQLKLVLEHMLSATVGHYIGMEEAEKGWLQLKETLRTEAARHTATLNLSGTWEEIEQRILLAILQKEGMNQSRTAQRLGINRSTLWRKLKNVLHY